jgi:hypothetical protein
MTNKRRLAVSFICCVTTALLACAPESIPKFKGPVSLGAISIDGISLMMTEDGVLQQKGQPPKRKEMSPGHFVWLYDYQEIHLVDGEVSAVIGSKLTYQDYEFPSHVRRSQFEDSLTFLRGSTDPNLKPGTLFYQLEGATLIAEMRSGRLSQFGLFSSLASNSGLVQTPAPMVRP